MIYGIGVDFVEVARMRRALESPWADRFVRKVFTPEERSTCEAAPSPVQAFAARFAAKEAVSKALGTGFSRGVTPRSLRVTGGERNRPGIELAGKALEFAAKEGIGAIHVSLTHTPTAACAFAVAEKALEEKY